MTDGLGFRNALSFSGHTNHAERVICILPRRAADHTSAFQILHTRLFQVFWSTAFSLRPQKHFTLTLHKIFEIMNPQACNVTKDLKAVSYLRSPPWNIRNVVWMLSAQEQWGICLKKWYQYSDLLRELPDSCAIAIKCNKMEKYVDEYPAYKVRKSICNYRK